MKLRKKLSQLHDAKMAAVANNDKVLADKIWRDLSILEDYLDPPDDEHHQYNVTDACEREISRILRTKYV